MIISVQTQHYQTTIYGLKVSSSLWLTRLVEVKTVKYDEQEKGAETSVTQIVSDNCGCGGPEGQRTGGCGGAGHGDWRQLAR